MNSVFVLNAVLYGIKHMARGRAYAALHRARPCQALVAAGGADVVNSDPGSPVNNEGSKSVLIATLFPPSSNSNTRSELVAV